MDLSAPRSIAELEERLSRPTPLVIESLSRMKGDLVILGVAGKMGPTLARMARRALDEAGSPSRVIGVARFSDSEVASALSEQGIETVRCDLLDRESVKGLPDATNVIYMAGQKFGTTDAPERTWAMNVLAPAIAAERYSASRIVAFSTGCVYPNASVDSGGSREDDPLEPLGEYANSCVGRERIFEHFAAQHGTQLALLRLNYAVDLRYGVLVDVAYKVWRGEPIDLAAGYVNVIWQGDAGAAALRCLEHAAIPPLVLNLTGSETLSIREVATQLGALLRRDTKFVGKESATALLSNAEMAQRLLGAPWISAQRLIQWVAEWIQHGGTTLDKPTHYDVRDGRY